MIMSRCRLSEGEKWHIAGIREAGPSLRRLSHRKITNREDRQSSAEDSQSKSFFVSKLVAAVVAIANRRGCSTITGQQADHC